MEERSAPDLWSQLQLLIVLFGEKGKQQEELNRFTEHEKVEIRQAIRQMGRPIAEGHTLTSEQVDLVHSHLDYLEDTDRLNRFDWSSLLLGILVSIVITLSIDTEQVKQ